MSKKVVHYNDMHAVYGWKNGFGKWNPYGQFKNPYSSYSACNEYTSNGPVLVDREGKFYGRLTMNAYASGSVCGATGSEKICVVKPAIINSELITFPCVSHTSNL